MDWIFRTLNENQKAPGCQGRCYLAEANAAALQQQQKKKTGMKTWGRETGGAANMPGQNMLSWVHPLAFTLLQIYFPPVKFFMRRRWLCSVVMPELLHSWSSWNSTRRVGCNLTDLDSRYGGGVKGLHLEKVAKRDFSTGKDATGCYATTDYACIWKSACELHWKIDLLALELESNKRDRGCTLM